MTIGLLNTIYTTPNTYNYLKKAGILKTGEWRKLSSLFKEILTEIREGKFKPDMNSEDIHTEIQNRIEKKQGHWP